MKTAVIINLDYKTQPVVQCRALWGAIALRMEAAGFVRASRRFVTPEGAEMACKLAREVMESIDQEYRAAGASLNIFLRDFYCVPCDQIIDLLRPPMHAVEVDLMATGAFDKFFKA